MTDSYGVPPAGIEPARMAPEAIALSTELRGHFYACEYIKVLISKQSKIIVY